MSLDDKKKIKLIDWLIFAFILILYTMVTSWLFYHQAYGNEGSFHSDMKAYLLEMQGIDSGYSFPYPLFFKMGAFFHLFFVPEVAITIALTLLNSFAVIGLKYYMQKYTEKILPKMLSTSREKFLLISIVVTGIVFAMFLVSMLFSLTGQQLPGIAYRYRGVFTPNPYHNATYLATRGFGIIAFFQLNELLAEYESNFSLKKGFLFSTFLFLTTITKPSFTFVIVGTAGFIMLYRLIKTKGKNLLPSMYLGTMFLPTFFHLIYQFFGVFGPTQEGESGIGFGLFEVWSMHCENIPLAIVLAMAFPIVVCIINFKEIKKDNSYRLSLQVFLTAFIMFALLYEKGFRKQDLNFSWGYMHGINFAFIGSSLLLLKTTIKREKPIILLVLQWCVLGWHLLCGLLYFKNFLAGFMYY